MQCKNYKKLQKITKNYKKLQKNCIYKNKVVSLQCISEESRKKTQKETKKITRL